MNSTMIEHENDPVWTPLLRATGEAVFGLGTKKPLAYWRKTYPAMTIVARWDAEQPGWVIAPPAPVEVTGVPRRYEVVANDGETATWFTDAKEAWASADRFNKRQPHYAPYTVEACIPVPRNEENDG